MLALLLAAAVVATDGSTSGANAETAAPPQSSLGPRFGLQGQPVTSVGIGLSGNYQTTPGTDGLSSFTIELDPGVDWFVLDNLSLGLSALIVYSGNRETSSRSDDISAATGPRVGYNIPLGGRFSFWPRLNLSLGYAHDAFTGGGVRQFLNFDPEVIIPLEIELAPHVVMGLGPYVEAAFSFPFDQGTSASSSMPTTWIVGWSSSIAGYF